MGRCRRWRDEWAASHRVRGRKGAQVLGTAVTTEHGELGKRGGKERARRVLVVEDEALICVETADTFEHQGFEAHIALNGEDALRRLRGGLAVDILFTDINLGGAVDGIALARLARELMPDLVVVYTSGTVQSIAQAVTGSRFAPKPYSPDRIGRMLRAMCAENAA
jgi:DNA-binding NtrC family response regulator